MMLSAKVSRMTLVGKEERKLEELAEKILFHRGLSARISLDIKSALPSAGIVIFGPEAGVVGPEHLSPGAVACILAGTGLSGSELAEARDDVLVVEGGLVSVPGNIQGMISAPLAEAVLMALEGVRGDPEGFGVSIEKVKKTASMAAKHGFRTAGIKGCKGVITGEDVERVKYNAGKKGSGSAAIP